VLIYFHNFINFGTFFKTVLHELYCFVISSTRALLICGHKTKAFERTKLSVFKLVFVPILTYGHECLVMFQKVLYLLHSTEKWNWQKFSLHDA